MSSDFAHYTTEERQYHHPQQCDIDTEDVIEQLRSVQNKYKLNTIPSEEDLEECKKLRHLNRVYRPQRRQTVPVPAVSNETSKELYLIKVSKRESTGIRTNTFSAFSICASGLAELSKKPTLLLLGDHSELKTLNVRTGEANTVVSGLRPVADYRYQ